ncbi:MAG: hypothetical protein NDJ90_05065 [Oligoflexia bacterium]|nr:hypothetical protein [Oligoflexia bacterium]
MRSRQFSVSISLAFILASFPAFAQEGSTSAETATFAQRAGKGLNPDTGVNFLGLYRKSVRGNDPASARPNGFHFQEAELQFSADVDPYLRAVGLFSVGEGIEPEEVYAETLSLPALTLRLGKFKAALGRHNLLHTHAFPFIDAPLVNEALLGEEGLNDVGASGSVLLPAPWFAELTLQAMAGGSETLYGSGNPNHLVGVAQWKNLWDLTDDSTLEWELFGTLGNNRFDRRTHAYGTDLTFKWRPSVGGKYRSVTWTTEYLNGLIAGNAVGGEPVFGPRLGGLSTWLQYQFAERWWAQGRMELLGHPRSEGVEPARKQSVLLGFFPSEFSGFRLQYDHLSQTGQPDDHSVAFQWNISIGAHPAHLY